MTKEELVRLCSERDEGLRIDFKRDQYHFDRQQGGEAIRVKDGTAELIKDIMAFANAKLDKPSYIVIGVQEGGPNPHEIVGIDEDKHIDDAKLQNKVKNKTNKPLRFSISRIADSPMEGKVVQVIKIEPNPDGIQYYLKQKMEHVYPNVIYRRRGSSTDMLTPEEIISEAQEQWNIRKTPKVDITWGSPNKNGTDLIAVHLKVITRPPKRERVSRTGYVFSSYPMPIKSMIAPFQFPRESVVSSCFREGPSDEECVESVKTLMSRIHLKVNVSLDEKYQQAALNAHLFSTVNGKGIAINKFDFADVHLPGVSTGYPLRGTFLSHNTPKTIDKRTVQPGTLAVADVFIKAEASSDAEINLAVSSDNADMQERISNIRIKVVQMELYRSSMMTIANTLNSMDAYDKWLAFLCENTQHFLIRNAEDWDYSIKKFAKDEFGYSQE